MTTPTEHYKDGIFAELRAQAVQVQDLEEQWKIQRETLRELALAAVIDGKHSIQSVADTAHVHRKTLTIWVQVRQAEIKGRQSRG